MKDQLWYQLNASQVVDIFDTDLEKGLPSKEAKQRLAIYGANRIEKQTVISPVKIFMAQFTDFMVLVLIAATLISGMLGEYDDAITILIIVVINAVLGFFQEYKAEKSMEALKKLAAPEALVLRSGGQIKIPAQDVVPGDILYLNTGDKIAADLRLIDGVNLEVEESLLTGESTPVEKDAHKVYNNNLSLGDRGNMAYLGTAVTKGRARGVVVATGMQTEMGHIAKLMETVAIEETPLQKRLAQLGVWLVFSCLLICAVVVLLGIMRGEPTYQMFLAGVSLAVAAIPEGLPAIVTVALAIGVQKMAKRNSIVRKLPAVETLGCATVICADKTGTLTQNEMTIKEVFAGGKSFFVTGEGYEPRGELIVEGEKKNIIKGTVLDYLLKAAVLCNNSSLTRNGINLIGLFRRSSKQIDWGINGDPTEGALLSLGAKLGYWREVVEKEEVRVSEFPFDSERKRMTVITKRGNELLAYTKGAPDLILKICNSVMIDGKVINLTEEEKRNLLSQNEQLANKALRVLALAFKPLGESVNLKQDEQIEKDLVFLGLVGMIDPPRKEAIKAVKVCQKAGIRPIMITGDHQATALAIAKEMGFHLSQTGSLTGTDLDQISDKELQNQVERISVYARVSPKHKLRIVKALKNQGHIVAMTGDGINDAPAVKEADIGIAMGKGGTDVTKEASAMILADDNFATIVAAVEEGRAIYDNIRKFIRYLLSCNTGEVLTMFFAALLGMPMPLLAIQILWVNLVTDGFPALALGVDSASPDLMNRKPRGPKESIFSQGLGEKILTRGLIISFGTLFAYSIIYYLSGGDLLLSRTVAFATLVFSQLFYVFDCRSEYFNPFEIGYFGNKYLVVAVTLSAIMQLSVIYLPYFQPIFKTVPLNLLHWLLILGIAGGRTVFLGLKYFFSTPQKKVFSR
ncbi:MAG: calcium-translocating P-type ATPase, SERCA-type [Bacillota bacterium]